ncbi:MAG TPA: AAA family ATPase [Spirochaetota bacterium]|nr:AAA family ATPase [Spirochaetota bacterium]HOL57885.1 AAA family ATPase [Spirochaetota bacterium]HPP05441.1 AAA family ATPase [Spirochaetota bacterium]
MFIKKLTLNGFKSFCDEQEIIFDKGISAIVGPNGCGKSNIVDAIKWVIGEQKTKMLRATNMTDVIFKGTEERKGLGRAEVTLTIVNENNILPLEYNEIEISRIIYASGESEYYINKQRVRLKDIQELFFDTGIGKSAYSVMEQGKIDLILSNKPEERRYIIEEAAGITKYRVKREEAQAKLNQADENIIRVKDIIKEVKSQYDSMLLQAQKAEKYKKLYDREIQLEIELNLNRISNLKKEREKVKDDLQKVEKELEEIKKRIDDLQDEVTERLTTLNELENKKLDKQREIFQIDSEIKIVSNRVTILKEQLINITSTLKNDKEKLSTAESKIAEIDRELESIYNTAKDFDNKIVSLIKDEDFYNNEIIRLDNEIANNEQSILNLKKKIESLNFSIEEKRVEHKKITDQLVEKIDKSLNTLEINSEEISSIKKQLKERLDYLINDLPKRRDFIDDIVKTGYLSKESQELISILKELKEKMIGVENNIKEIKEGIEKYIEITNIFMNDLFSPEGILQQKRKVENEISSMEKEIKECNQKILELEKEINLKKETKEKDKEMLSEIRINISTLKEKKNSIEKEVSRINALKLNYEHSRDELSQKIEFTTHKIEEIRDNIAETEGELLSLKEKKNLLEKESREIEINIQKENLKMSDEQKYIKEINTKWDNKKSFLERLSMKVTEIETTLKNIYDSFYENFSINLSEYESKGGYITNREYDEIRKDLLATRNEKSSLGSVNLMAIEECKILEERYNLLTEQLEDLEKAKKDILVMIEDINKVSEELFMTTFNQIKANFHKIFRKLFDGGNAEISLTNPDNILETGIEITAHPPGQKNQSITLLSGGQRTMTAIALMFATFLVKLSPFCILDEIDAALDEENVGRFINLLKEFKESSQFVIITHNKKTISAADIMYGITQETKGVSKIVSAKFKEKAI